MLRVGAVRYSPQPQYWLVDNMEPGQKEGKQGMVWIAKGVDLLRVDRAWAGYFLGRFPDEEGEANKV